MISQPAAVDDLRGEILALADACVLCGQCLPVCPTYGLDQREAESPRGRIMLMQQLAAQPEADRYADSDALDHCLSCGRCEAMCPAKVRFGRLMDLSRQLRRPRRSASWTMRGLLFIVARPVLLAWLLRLARWPARWLPGRWMRLLTAVQAPIAVPEPVAVTDRRPAVILFEGCVERHAEAAAFVALRRILDRLGWQVINMPMQGCCGALARHAGEALDADRLAQSNQRALAASVASAPVSPSFVLTLSTGCHKEVEDALGKQVPVLEAMAFLLAHTPLRAWPFRPSDIDVVVHSPCTARPNSDRRQFAAEEMLRLLPGIRLHRIAPQGCCGAAGAHMLQFPQRAEQLAAPVLEEFSSRPQARWCTSNVGCHLHLQSLAGAKARPMQHPLVLIDEAM
ncbi:MAG: (Fe-S)-binding protein [Lysobacteraceae bacterium]